MYQRKQLEILKSRMAEPRRTIQVIMGPRQVGKTTLVTQFTEQTGTPFDFISADNVNRFDSAWISDRWEEARIKMDAGGQQERILIIDEIQKINNWSEVVKGEWDTDTRKQRNLKVILLGSSRLLLQKGLNESMEGRFETIKLGYWNWDEMRDAFGISMQEYCYFGGFPGLAYYIGDEDRWRNMMEDSIISPILNRDILEIEEIRNPALLRQVFELGATYSAQELSLTKMQGTINSGSVPTIGVYLEILDQTMLVKPLQKYEPSAIKEKNSVPKMQTYNNAFRNRYSRHSFAEAQANLTEWGRVVESAVGAHLANRSISDDFKLLYWRDSRRHEVDYVLQKGERIVAIEVKSGEANDLAGYRIFNSQYADKIAKSLIVGPKGLPLEDFFTLDLKALFR